MEEKDRREVLAAAGRWLKAQRERRNLTAREIAARLDVLPQTVYNWESGKSGLDDDRAQDISRLFGMDLIEVRRNLGLWVPDDDQTDVPADRDERLAHAEAIANRAADELERLREELRQLRGDRGETA